MGIPRRPGALFSFDPGWLYLIAGMALLAATVLIPAGDDLDRAEHARDEAIALEKHRTARLENYAAYLDALTQRDETLIRSLAAEHLNLAPAHYEPLPDPTTTGLTDLSPFPKLEPAFVGVRRTPVVETLLRRLATSDVTRIWLLAAGAMCILVGLLPDAKRGEPRRLARTWWSRLKPKWLAASVGTKRPPITG